MKRKVLLGSALAAFLFMSCTTETKIESGEQEASIPKKEVEAKETEEKKEETKEVAEGQIQSRYAYDQDWESIKEALISKDAAKIQDWIHEDKVKADDLTWMISDPNLVKALKATKYEDLKSEEQNGEQVLTFYYEETGTDDEGNEVGMSISIYLHQGDPNLKIWYVLAAG